MKMTYIIKWIALVIVAAIHTPDHNKDQPETEYVQSVAYLFIQLKGLINSFLLLRYIRHTVVLPMLRPYVAVARH